MTAGCLLGVCVCVCVASCGDLPLLTLIFMAVTVLAKWQDEVAACQEIVNRAKVMLFLKVGCGLLVCDVVIPCLGLSLPFWMGEG